MPGFEENRFFDLSQREAKELSCGICLNIFDNAVISDQCVHSYCKDCIQTWIRGEHNECPECKTVFTRKRTRNTANFVIIGGYVFKANLTANRLISQLTAKCDFEFNGCEERVIFEAMVTHLKVCKNKFCTACGFPAGKSDVHNCVELLKKDRDQLSYQIIIVEEVRDRMQSDRDQKKNEIQFLKNDRDRLQEEQDVYRKKYEMVMKISQDLNEQNKTLETRVRKLEDENKKLIKRCSEQLEEQARTLEKNTQSLKVKRLEHMLSESLDNTKQLHQDISHLVKEVETLEEIAMISIQYENILIGSHTHQDGLVEMNSRGIHLHNIPMNRKKNSDPLIRPLIIIPFTGIQKLMHCTDSSLTAIVIKTDYEYCKKIQTSLNLGPKGANVFGKLFDINSYEPKHWYIIIEFGSNMSGSKVQILITYLGHKSNKYEHNVKFEAINFNQYKQLLEITHNWRID